MPRVLSCLTYKEEPRTPYVICSSGERRVGGRDFKVCTKIANIFSYFRMYLGSGQNYKGMMQYHVFPQDGDKVI